MNTPQFLNAIVDWLLADPAHFVVASSALAALIPTPDPSTPWGRVYKVIDMLALNVLHAKESGVNVATVAQEVAEILAKQQPSHPNT